MPSKNSTEKRETVNQRQIDAEKSRRRLSEFVRRGWHVLEPTTPLVWNWHIPAICDHVQAMFEDWVAVQKWKQENGITDDDSTAPVERIPNFFGGNTSQYSGAPHQRIKNLVINVPPGTAKSRIVSVYFPAWAWLIWPSWRGIFLSSNPSVALRDSTLCRDLIESDWYQSRFKPDWELRSDQNAKSNYWNTKNGWRRSSGWFAKITGDRADAIVVDDPHDADPRALSDANILAVVDRWDNAIRNRVNDPETSNRLAIMQRLDAKDFSAHVLGKGGWQLLCLPQLFEPQRLKENPDFSKHEYPAVSPIGFRDPRTEDGELLFPQRFTPDVLAEEKVGLGEFGFAGQHQQRPAPATGGILKRHHWRFWIPADADPRDYPPVTLRLPDGSVHTHVQIHLPREMDLELQSWDMSFDNTADSAYVVGQVWGVHLANRFLLDQVREKMDFTQTIKSVNELTRRWPRAEAKLIENKANGPAVRSTLRDEISGLLSIDPEGDKVARARAETPTIESGNVYLPHPNVAPWVTTVIEESANFPKGAFKDIVDTMSQALMWIRKWLAAQKGNDSIPRSRSARRLF